MVNASENDSNNNKEHTSSHPILVELAGRMIGGGGQEQEQTQKNVAQVTSL